MIAGAATMVVGWCLFATAAVLLSGPSLDPQLGGSDRRIARAERDLKQARAAEQIALSLLEKRTSEFQQQIQEAEQRHGTLKVLMAHLQGQDTATAVALNGDSAVLLVDSTIEEASPRHGRPEQAGLAINETAGVRAQFDRLRYDQTAFLDAAEDEAVDRSERARGVIRQTGVPLARVLEESAVGGPLIEISNLSPAESGLTGTDGFIRRTQEVAARLQEAKLFETLIHTLPLGAPIGVTYRETSGFGYRSDPFTRRTAWHEGMDLAAYYGAPIIATAPGKVTYAGSRSSYGRVVEIDHGLGFKTRYGHLQSIGVKTGAEVAIGQKLGTMGSTGRSTGPHLHYEVFYRGKSYDPIKFLRAGKHVHEG